jgi:neutral/alkaline ceramidase-like enzyme
VIRRTLLALAVLLLLVARTAAAQPCADCLGAGASRVQLQVPPGTPLAGYGNTTRRLLLPDVLDRYPHAFWFKPSRGERDPLAVRALVLEVGSQRVAWVSLDLLAVDQAFTADVVRALAEAGGRPAALLLSASHTHSGPGAYVDSAVLGWLAVDSLDRSVRAGLLDATVSAVRQAAAAVRPARLATASVTAPPLVSSRIGRALDAEMLVLRVAEPSGRPIALVWNYAIHGTALGPRNLRLSGDLMGEASRRLEQELDAPVLFVNGAVGDVSPIRHGDRAVVDLGAALAAAARDGWRQAEPVASGMLAIGHRTIGLPPPYLSAHNCLRGWLPRAVGLPLGSVFPRETTLIALALGDLGVVTIPGELQTSLGRGIKDAAATMGLRRVLVAGLSAPASLAPRWGTAWPRPPPARWARWPARAARSRIAPGATGEVPGAASGKRRDGGRARTSSGRRCCGGSRPCSRPCRGSGWPPRCWDAAPHLPPCGRS